MIKLQLLKITRKKNNHKNKFLIFYKIIEYFTADQVDNI